jgi:hypothetical protein
VSLVWIAQWVCIAWRFIVDPVWTAICWSRYWLCILPECLYNLALNVRLCIYVYYQCVFVRRDKPPNSRQKPGRTLTFDDDFSTPGVDPNKWVTTYANGDFWNYGLPDNFLSPTSFAFPSNAIDLLGENVPISYGGRNFNYQAGHLEWPSFEQQHGYFEIRCKIPDTIEMWPAFWLVSHKIWPPEIDIFEFYTNDSSTFETTHHWGTDVNGNHPKETRKHRACAASKLFHIYACEWDATQIRWYYDNLLIRVASNGLSDFVVPMSVIVNNAVDSRAGHSPQNATFPSHFVVDYVRVWS